ncbi:MAG TPA: GNAT family N-acetyltransferase [Methylibium sp.]
MPEPVTLRSDRLTIRPLLETDLAGVFALYDNVDVGRFCKPVRWPSMDYAHGWYARIEQRVAEGSTLQFVIELAQQQTLIGTCLIFQIDEENRRAEVGYALGRDFWGRGYASEALQALIEHGFGTLGLHRLEAVIDPRNTASAKVLTRHGFRLEGQQRERWIESDGSFGDSGLYGLLRQEWTGPAAMR